MYKPLLFAGLSLFFIGCSNNTNAFNYFKTDELKARITQHTKKADLISKKKQDVLMWATYLNNIKSSKFKYKNESFVVSFYFVNKDEQVFDKSKYNLTLNGNEALKFEKISKDNLEYKELFDSNPWGEYYFVQFPSKKRVYDLKLKLSTSDSKAQLKFSK